MAETKAPCAAAVAAPADLPPDADDDDVHRPSHHRGGLYFGMLLLAWWLIAAASGPNAYAKFQWFIETLIGRLILFGFTWALIHHMLGGIRHLIWDTGRGFGPVEREWLTLAGLIGSIGLTDPHLGRRLSRARRRAMSGKSVTARRSRACAISARRIPAPCISGVSA